MTQVTIDAELGGGYLESEHATDYALARAGATMSIDRYGTDELVVGQDRNGAQFQLYQAFMKFDTSVIPDSATIDSAICRLSGRGTSQDVTPFVYDLLSGYDWGTLATTDWRTTAQLGALTLRASVASSAWSVTSFDLTNISLPAAINKTGMTELILVSDRLIAATAPTQNEYDNIDGEGVAGGPQLIINYTEAAAGGVDPIGMMGLFG